jgi:hypothetical protein
MTFGQIPVGARVFLDANFGATSQARRTLRISAPHTGTSSRTRRTPRARLRPLTQGKMK